MGCRWPVLPSWAKHQCGHTCPRFQEFWGGPGSLSGPGWGPPRLAMLGLGHMLSWMALSPRDHLGQKAGSLSLGSPHSQRGHIPTVTWWVCARATERVGTGVGSSDPPEPQRADHLLPMAPPDPDGPCGSPFSSSWNCPGLSPESGGPWRNGHLDPLGSLEPRHSLRRQGLQSGCTGLALSPYALVHLQPGSPPPTLSSRGWCPQETRPSQGQQQVL